ncbi:MAG: PD-(D/E)XK nuclease family transposase [Lachnospiraceae bacterium]|nr:PD-(D/E)XK nuclease family transposase [Lachnospiraceae bacterium]
MNEERKYEMKPLEEMNVIDNFLFTQIMSDEEIGAAVCSLILSRVLKREVSRISFRPQKTIQGVSEKTHGIRLDAYVTEKTGESEYDIKVYDVEPDKRSEHKAGLPKRSRYYGDLIDVQLLSTGSDYEKLPELVTIFILSYDPFGENAMYYEAATTVKTHPHLEYDDGVRRIFLYVDGELPEEAGEDDSKLRNLLNYISNSTRENAIDDDTRMLDSIVRRVKARKEVGVEYMKSWEIEREIREDARKEERENTERERARADREKARADAAEARIKELESMSEKARADAEKARADAAEARIKELESMSEKARADREKARADAAEARVKELEAMLGIKK